MTTKKYYDVIILGGGPAGLSLASELSKKFRVVVIELSHIGNSFSTRDWTTENSYLVSNNLSKFVSIPFKKSSIRSIVEASLFVRGEYVTVKGKELLSFWAKELMENSGDVIEHCQVLEILRSGNSIEIQTTKGDYSSKVLVDCTGIDSKLAVENDLYEKVFYFPIYGGEYRIKLKNEEVNLFGVMVKRSPLYYYEVFPVNKSKCVFYTFQYLTEPKNPHDLLKAHSFHMHNGYLKDRIIHKKKVRKILGTIPMGTMKHNSLDRIAFFGDSALMAAPITGSGFTNILNHYKRFAEHIGNCIKNDRLDAANLSYRYSRVEEMNRKIQLVLAASLPTMKPKKYNALVSVLKTMPNKLILDFLLLRLTPEGLLVFVKTLSSRIRLQDILHISQELFLDSIDKISGKFSKNSRVQ